MNNQKPSVMLISIDALKPDYLFKQNDIGVNLPNLTKYFIKNGTYASDGMKGVFPTFTYPSHQSIITGTNPAKHGIYNNVIFDPMEKHNNAWYWFANDKVETLWEAAKNNNYISASVAFPTSVGAKGDYIAPEFWWDGSELDSEFIDAVSKPQGMVKAMEKDIGRYPNGLDLTESGDRQRFKAAMWMLQNILGKNENGKPFFMSAYFASFDETAHINGVYSKEAIHSIELIDDMVGELVEQVHRMTNYNSIVCVVSDHGSIDNQYNISPNVLFAKAGMIQVDNNEHVRDWKVWSQRAGGTSEIRLKDKNDTETKEKVEEILNQLKMDDKSGILEVLNNEESVKRGGFADCDFVLVARKGYELRDNAAGEYCTTDISQKAQHGYSEEFEEMRASFLIEGKGIRQGRDIGKMNLIDVAPTLAELMGFSLPDADGISVFEQ